MDDFFCYGLGVLAFVGVIEPLVLSRPLKQGFNGMLNLDLLEASFGVFIGNGVFVLLAEVSIFFELPVVLRLLA